VAELLRDVGPALVVTILLDGPQLGSRWTAPCASVLADDPGSAVLTADGDARVSLARAALGTAFEARRDVGSVTSVHG
jgi:hypothetical protein